MLKQIHRFLILLFLTGAATLSGVWAQDEPLSTEATLSRSTAPSEDRLETIRGEMNSRLARLEDLQRELAERQQGLEKVKEDLATESDNLDQMEAARETLAVNEDWIASLKREIAEQQRLYDQAAARFQIARDQASLSSGESLQRSTQEGDAPTLLDTFQRRNSHAAQEALLAKQLVQTLKGELDILESRQKRLREEFDRLNRFLDEGDQLNRQQRQTLTTERQRVVDEERQIDDRLNELRSQKILAETSLRLTQEEAQREQSEYQQWKRQLATSLILLLSVIALLFLLRLLVARFVKNPDRRYAANRSLSISMTLILLIGLAVIFLRQFPSLMTGIGVVLAGVAIALQEVILSFIGFFAVRGPHGYRVGDWVRMGGDYGEVVDISLSVTVLEEVTPIDFQFQQGGTKTGALTRINNSAIFREKMTNYTRGFPFLWCAMTFTITYESNRQAAEEMVRTILEGHDEIITTAKLARKRITHATSDFALKIDNTAPRVRTWPADSGISLRLRFMVHPRRRRALIDTINRQVIDAFTSAPDIDFAYNTLRVISTPADEKV